MKFDKFENVPDLLKPFYTTETVDEPTGNFVDKEVPAFDDQGNPTTSIIKVPEYVPVTYVIPLPRHDLKTWDDLQRVNTLHSLTKPEFVQYVQAKAEEADGWAFHDKYLVWFTELETLRNTYPEQVPGTEDDPQWVNGLSPEVKIQLLQELETREPVRTVNPMKDAILQEMAKETKDLYTTQNIILDGVEWQVRPLDRDNMRSRFETAQRNDTLTAKVVWILADNTLHETTAEVLARVLDAYAERLDEATQLYATWRAGDRASMFVIKS